MNPSEANPEQSPGADVPPAATEPAGNGAPPASAAGGADPLAETAALLRKAEAEALAMKDAYLRSRAEAENIRRQAQSDVAKAHKFAIEKFAENLLPVRDALETALATATASPEALRSGVELTLRQLSSAFDKAQLTVIDPAGQKFDPHQHQAMAMIDSDQPANTVVQVMQKGYRLNDRVLRPALVAVAKAKD